MRLLNKFISVSKCVADLGGGFCWILNRFIVRVKFIHVYRIEDDFSAIVIRTLDEDDVSVDYKRYRLIAFSNKNVLAAFWKARRAVLFRDSICHDSKSRAINDDILVIPITEWDDHSEIVFYWLGDRYYILENTLIDIPLSTNSTSEKDIANLVKKLFKESLSESVTVEGIHRMVGIFLEGD